MCVVFLTVQLLVFLIHRLMSFIGSELVSAMTVPSVLLPLPPLLPKLQINTCWSSSPQHFLLSPAVSSLIRILCLALTFYDLLMLCSVVSYQLLNLSTDVLVLMIAFYGSRISNLSHLPSHFKSWFPIICWHVRPCFSLFGCHKHSCVIVQNCDGSVGGQYVSDLSTVCCHRLSSIELSFHLCWR